MTQAGFSTVSVDMDKVEAVRSLLLDTMADKGINTGYGMLGCLLTVGGLSAENGLSDDESAKFIQDAMNWISLYWAGQGKGMN